MLCVIQHAFDDTAAMATARETVLREMVSLPPEGIAELVSSPYGNYVVQKALAVEDHPLVKDLASMVRPLVGQSGISFAAGRKLRRMLGL